MIYLETAELAKPETAHEYLQEKLEFPAYYGRNLDALHDCLTELDDTQITILHNEEMQSLYLTGLLSVFRDAAEENPGLILTEVYPEESIDPEEWAEELNEE